MAEIFRSQAEEIRHYVRQLLDDGNEYTVKMIKEFVEEQSGKEFSDGAFAGSLRDLVKNNPEFISPRRGIYKKEGSTSKPSQNPDHLEDEVVKILQNTVSAIYEQVDHLNPLTITEQQQKTLDLLKKTITAINISIEEIQKND